MLRLGGVGTAIRIYVCGSFTLSLTRIRTRLQLGFGPAPFQHNTMLFTQSFRVFVPLFSSLAWGPLCMVPHHTFPDPTLFAADPTLSDPTINFANPKIILQFRFSDPLISFLPKLNNAWINTFSSTLNCFGSRLSSGGSILPSWPIVSGSPNP